MALWLALDQVSETERVARQAGRLRPLDLGPSGRPTFLHLAGARSLGPWARWQRPLRGGGIMQGSRFHQNAPSQNSLAGGTIHSDVLNCSRYVGGILMTEDCLKQ